MQVKEVVCSALRLVGMEELADAITNSSALTAGQTRIMRAFVTYFNSVLDELARGYFPLDAREDITCVSGVIALSAFSNRPVKIKRIMQGGKKVEWRLTDEGLVTPQGLVTVYYQYAPPTLTENDEFDYPLYNVGERLVEFGMVAEHYLVSGNATLSHLWEERYRDEIEALLSKSSVRDRIPPRRWI